MKEMFTQSRVRGAEVLFTKGISDEDATRVLVAISQIQGVDSITTIRIDKEDRRTNIKGDGVEDQITTVLKLKPCG